MKKLSLLFAAVAVFVSCNLRAEVVEISSAAELSAEIAANPSGDYKLKANIDCSTWASLDFSGTLDGDGKTITGLTVPLFGTVSGNATIKNLVVSGAAVSSETADIGIVATTMTEGSFVIQNISFVNCSLSLKSKTGGMVVAKLTTATTALLSNCSMDDSCKVTVRAGAYVGGLFGSVTANGDGAEVTISNCVSRGTLTINDWTNQGAGIVNGIYPKMAKYTHHAYVNVYDCTNYMSAAANGANGNLGGVVRYAEGGTDSINGDIRIARCVNFGNLTVKSPASETGGIISGIKNCGAEIVDCVNYGNISHTGASKAAGGVVGSVNNIIKDSFVMIGCANEGSVTGTDAGGLIGDVSQTTCTGYTILSSFNRGTITNSRDGFLPGQAIGYLKSTVAYPSITISGSAFMSDTLIGGMIAGASVPTLITESNVDAATSEGLVSGADLESLNAYNDDCNLWKQGSSTPILKIMPDEAAPDTITATFVDAEDFESVVLKTCVILRGGTPIPPSTPEHDGYTFTGWSPETFSDLTSDTVITAVYMSGTIEHTVRFFDWDESQIGADQLVGHGKPAEAPASPVRDGYLFTGWDGDFSNVIEDLDVHATYVQLVQDVSTGEELENALKTAIYPEVTYRLTGDVALRSDWTTVDEFVSQIDGSGYVIHYNGSAPIVAKLSGRFANFILDGDNDGSVTSVNNISSRFGMLAIDCRGGRIANVVVRNYSVKVSNSASGVAVGVICGAAGDGAIIEQCSVESNCTLTVRSITAGGISGCTVMSDAWTGDDLMLLSIVSCTNCADIVTVSSGGQSLGGIIGEASSQSSVQKPEIIVSNCVNYGRITSTYAAGAEGRFAGIVGFRTGNVNSGTLCGSLTIVDCENYGDIDSQGAGPKVYYGGIFGYTYRLGAISISRCKNMGRIGGRPASATYTVTGGASGGIVAYLDDVYGKRPIFITDSANYGEVIGGSCAGGQVGYVSANADYGDVFVISTNCANYASVSVLVDGGYAGEWIGDLNTNPKETVAPRCGYGALNSFFMTENLVGHTAGAVANFEGYRTPQDDGYTSRSAVKALDDWATANGYESWVEGKIGNTVYPELRIFCANPQTAPKGLKILFR